RGVPHALHRTRPYLPSSLKPTQVSTWAGRSGMKVPSSRGSGSPENCWISRLEESFPRGAYRSRRPSVSFGVPSMLPDAATHRHSTLPSSVTSTWLAELLLVSGPLTEPVSRPTRVNSPRSLHITMPAGLGSSPVRTSFGKGVAWAPGLGRSPDVGCGDLPGAGG